MDDMQTFERDIAGVIQRAVGPERPVDAMAIVRTTATQSPKWRFGSMFSATKFIVAGAIVALFGGFLLAGVLMQQDEESVPAAGALASPPALTADAAATAPSAFAVELTGAGDRKRRKVSVDPATGIRTMTGIFTAIDPDREKGTGFENETQIWWDQLADQRALGNVTEVWAQSRGLTIPDLGLGSDWADAVGTGVMVERRSTRVENDGGAWVGTAIVPAIGFGTEAGAAVWELVGEGGYEGLTMFLWAEYVDEPTVLNGIIVPSDSVPDMPPPPADAGAE